MNLEVLSPAGNEQALKAAFAGGADAVYLALPQFGARAYAANFTLDQVAKAIEDAHLAGKRIYVTMNTLIEEDHMEEAYQQAKALHELGVDALIIQDLGLIHLLHHRLPNLELHASTQLSVSTPYQIEQLRKLGVKRCVLAREATLDEIKACAATGMELEVFIHGALCISYSGQCRFSQVRYDRSANKGKCAQACRMEYTLEENGMPIPLPGKYLLSPKDLSAIDQISQLAEAGVFSLKIEGRMKSPEYVYESAAAARAAADGLRVGKELKVGMETAFNRGYTTGHGWKAKGTVLMNTETSNHQGIHLGKVIKVSHDRARIVLDEDLHQNDGLRFVQRNRSTGCNANFIFDTRGKLIAKAAKGETVEVRVPGGVFNGMEVRKTTSYLLQKDVEEAIRTSHPQADIAFTLKAAKIGDPLILEATDGTHTVAIEGGLLEAAQKAPSKTEQIVRSLKKTKDTWANPATIDVDLPDNAFIPVSILNTMRREAIDQLGALRLQRGPLVEVESTYQPKAPKPLPSFVQIQNKNQKTDLPLLQVSEFPIPGTERKSPIYKDEGYITDSLGKGEIVENLNITNSYAVAALLEMGYQGGVLAGELSDEDRQALLKAFKDRYGFEAPVILTVYEKPRLMVMKHCPVNTALKDGKRQNCSLCRTNRYTLLGKDGRRAFLYGNPDCRMQVFDEKAIDTIDQIPGYAREGVHAFRMVMSDESHDETEQLEKQMLENLEAISGNK